MPSGEGAGSTEAGGGKAKEVALLKCLSEVKKSVILKAVGKMELLGQLNCGFYLLEFVTGKTAHSSEESSPNTELVLSLGFLPFQAWDTGPTLGLAGPTGLASLHTLTASLFLFSSHTDLSQFPLTHHYF